LVHVVAEDDVAEAPLRVGEHAPEVGALGALLPAGDALVLVDADDGIPLRRGVGDDLPHLALDVVLLVVLGYVVVDRRADG
jgi:hypothetical protein